MPIKPVYTHSDIKKHTYKTILWASTGCSAFRQAPKNNPKKQHANLLKLFKELPLKKVTAGQVNPYFYYKRRSQFA